MQAYKMHIEAVNNMTTKINKRNMSNKGGLVGRKGRNGTIEVDEAVIHIIVLTYHEILQQCSF